MDGAQSYDLWVAAFVIVLFGLIAGLAVVFMMMERHQRHEVPLDERLRGYEEARRRNDEGPHA